MYPKVYPASINIWGKLGTLSEYITEYIQDSYTAGYISMAGGIPYGPNKIPWSESVSSLAKLPDGSYLVSPPCSDPLQVYPNVPDVNGALYQVPSSGLTAEQLEDANLRILARAHRYQSNLLGYQVNQALNYSHLRDYLDIHLNNAGDPFTESNGQTCTRWIERNVLDYFASLWRAKWPHDWADPETYWGYMLTMGSSEGNMYALWSARDYLRGKAIHAADTADSGLSTYAVNGRCDGKEEDAVPNPQHNLMAQRSHLETGDIAEHNLIPVALFSEDCHYSVTKTLAMVDVATFYQIGVEEFPGQCPIVAESVTPGEWPRSVPTKGGAEGPGDIDGEALCTLVNFFSARKYPILVIFNYGSTFKGAYDDVEGIGTRIVAILSKHQMLNCRVKVNGQVVQRQGYWMHVDGALGASYMPFMEMARMNGMTELGPGPVFDFRLPFVSSIVTSGHKWMGAPWPCGIFMTRTKLVLTPSSHNADIIGTPDTTLAGSRNGTTPLLLWNYISTHSYESQVKTVLRCMDLAEYTYQSLSRLQKNIGLDLWVTRTPLSLAVWFREPKEEIRLTFSLGGSTVRVRGTPRRYCHVYIMESTTKELIDRLLLVLNKDGAFHDNIIDQADSSDVGIK